MTLAVLHSRALVGMQALPVTVEVHLANGLPGFAIVGLPETEVKEARDRVRAALQNARFDFAGELALGGDLRPVRGALAMSLGATCAGRAFVLPLENAAEAALVERADVYGARNLLEVCAHFAGRERLVRVTGKPPDILGVYPDMREVKGQAHAKRA